MPVLKWFKKSKNIKNNRYKNKKKSKSKLKKILIAAKTFLFFSIIILSIVGSIILLNSSFFKVKHVICEKNGYPCENLEKQFFDEYKGKNIFYINLEEIKTKIVKNYTYIAKIESQKKLPDQIIIKVITRQPSAQMSKDEKTWFVIDSDGYVFKKIYNNDETLPKIIVNSNDLDIILGKKVIGKEFNQLLILLKELNNNYVLFNKILYNNIGKISINLIEGIEATFSMKKDITPQVDSLQLILRQSKIEGKLPKAIDLRFSKPVVTY